MNVSVTVIDATAKGVRVVVGSTDGPPFWIPRAHPAVVWSRQPEPGEAVTVRVPPWLIQKHGPLRELRHQRSLSFHQPPGLGPEASREGSFPMSDYPQDAGKGALFKNDKKEKPSHPDYRGDITIDGAKYRLAGWIKEGKNGKYLSLVARPFEEKPAAAPRQSAGGPSFADSDIPFAPEWR